MNLEVQEIAQEILEMKKVQEQIEKLANLLFNIKSHDLYDFLFMHKWMMFVFIFYFFVR